MPKYANACVTSQSHGLIAGAQTHYVTANRVRNRLPKVLTLAITLRPKKNASRATWCQGPEASWCSPGRYLESLRWFLD